MTDLERTEQLFQSLGYTRQDPVRDYHHGLGAREYGKEIINGETHLTFGDGFDETQPRKFGYGAFGFVLVFGHDGKFIGHGAYE